MAQIDLVLIPALLATMGYIVLHRELSGLSCGVVRALDCIVVFLKRKRDLSRLCKRMHIQRFPETFCKKVEAERQVDLFEFVSSLLYMMSSKTVKAT